MNDEYDNPTGSRKRNLRQVSHNHDQNILFDE